MSNGIETVEPSHYHTVVQLIATRTNVPDSMVCLFADFEKVLIGLLSDSDSPADRLIAIGNVTPEVQLASHKADRSLTEIVGVSPFTSDIESVLAAISNPSDTVFVSNPNRVTGTSWNLQELYSIAQAIPDGLLIIDEYYYDFHGISSDPLFARHNNIVILRSPAPSVGIATDAGYLIAPPNIIDRLSQEGQVGSVSVADMELLKESMYSAEILAERLRVMHDESLRIVGELSRIGIQCRITPFDNLLVRVPDPTTVGNHLARNKIAVDNLDGYTGLKNYIRVRVESPATNDRLIEAFRRLPETAVQARTNRSQILRLHRPAEGLKSSGQASASMNRQERIKTFIAEKTKGEKATA